MKKTSTNYELSDMKCNTINIAVLGDSKCGKSSLIDCYLHNKIEEGNIETVLNIQQKVISIKNFEINLNFFDISGNFKRDKDLIVEYLKISNIILLCHSFDKEFNEDNFVFWLEQIEQWAVEAKTVVYIIGCKYDRKIMMDYQGGFSITTLMFKNGNLASFGERVKNFINTNHIREYFLVSALLNINVKETFESILQDYIYEKYLDKFKNENTKDSNCLLF
jgi:small GTP-binding protein